MAISRSTSLVSVYSGGAKGADTISEQVAIKSGGADVSYIGDSLLSGTGKPDTLNKLESGKLLLITDVKARTGTEEPICIDAQLSSVIPFTSA